MQDTEYWTLIPNFISAEDDPWEELYAEMKDRCKERYFTIFWEKTPNEKA